MTHLAKGFSFIQRFALRNHLLAGREWIRHGADRLDLIVWHTRAHDSLVSRPRQTFGSQKNPNHQRSN
jgi:hypothetical protein